MALILSKSRLRLTQAKFYGNPQAAGGSGVTSLSQGAGITLTPNPTTTIGTIALIVPVTVPLGGTGVVTLAAGYVKSNGVATFTSQAIPIPVSDGGTGSITGPATALIVDDTATAATMFPLWVTANSGNLPIKVSSTKLTFVPSNGTLKATSIRAFTDILGPGGSGTFGNFAGAATDVAITLSQATQHTWEWIEKASTDDLLLQESATTRASFRANGGGLALGTVALADASAQLDVVSTTRGALIPRMTQAQKAAIGSPATGLKVTNTSVNRDQYYDGSTWRTIAGQTIRPEDYGAVPDAKNNSTGAINAASNSLTISGSDAFVAADAGKTIWISRAGAAGGMFKTTILTFNSGTNVTLNANATTSVVGTNVFWGTDNTVAFQAAATTANNNAYSTIELSQGRYVVDGAALLITNQNVMIRGQGSGSTYLYQASLTANLIEFAAAGANESVADLFLAGMGTACTAGAAISYSAGATFQSLVSRVWIQSFYNGIVIGNAANPGVSLRDTQIFDIVNDMVQSTGGVGWIYGQGFSVQNVITPISITGGFATLTATNPTFGVRHIGQRVVITNAGVGGNTPHISTITAVASTTSCTIASNATSSVVNGTGTVGFNTAAGIHLSNGGLYLEAISLVGMTKSMVWDPGNGQSILYTFAHGAQFDSAFDLGFQIVPSGTGVVRSCVFIDCWFASAGNIGNATVGANAYGILCSATQTVSNIKFIGCRIVNNGRTGVFLNAFAGGGWEFFDCTFDGNGSRTNNTFNHIDANAFTGLTVDHCRFQATDFAGGTTTLRAVSLTGVIGNILVTGNQFANTTTGIFEDAVTAAITTKDYRGNIGTVTLVDGVAPLNTYVKLGKLVGFNLNSVAQSTIFGTPAQGITRCVVDAIVLDNFSGTSALPQASFGDSATPTNWSPAITLTGAAPGIGMNFIAPGATGFTTYGISVNFVARCAVVAGGALTCDVTVFGRYE